MNLTSTVFHILQSGIETSSQISSLAAQNFANAMTSPENPQESPYRRHMAIVHGAKLPGGWVAPHVQKVIQDTKTPFQKMHDPYHPGADSSGFVSLPNVSSVLETTDYQENMHNQSVMAKMRETWSRTQRMLLRLITV